MKFVDVYTPSGIGDIYWVLQKLARSANEAGVKLRIHTPPGPGDKFSRGKFLEFIDCVESVTPDGISYAELVKRARVYERLEPVMYCECNTWLEAGRRLEHYLPAFPTEFVLNWEIAESSVREAGGHITPGVKNIVVYTSGRANNDSSSTGQWSAGDWAPRLRELRKLPDVRLIWIGANYDADILPGCRELFDVILIDRPADVVLSLLRLCDGFISFQSGLSCISAAESLPTFMLYFRKIAALSVSFHPPGADYLPVFFDDLPSFVPWVRSRTVSDLKPGSLDYTAFVDAHVEQTERDWLANGWIHDDQYIGIKDLDRKGERILEIGCGSGQLASRIKKAAYHGIDQSEKLLALARAKKPDGVFECANVRELKAHEGARHVCAFGFLKHFSLLEHDAIFSRLASLAADTLTVEMPIRDKEVEDKGHIFPHVWTTRERMLANAEACGFELAGEPWRNRSGEYIFRFKRVANV